MVGSCFRTLAVILVLVFIVVVVCLFACFFVLFFVCFLFCLFVCCLFGCCFQIISGFALVQFRHDFAKNVSFCTAFYYFKGWKRGQASKGNHKENHNEKHNSDSAHKVRRCTIYSAYKKSKGISSSFYFIFYILPLKVVTEQIFDHLKSPALSGYCFFHCLTNI